MATSGVGPQLVLLHGVGTDSSIWSAALPALALGHTVTTLDLPGFGASPPPRGQWTLEAVSDHVAEDLARAIDPPFDLLGSSLGGAVALTIAVRHPGDVRRLVLQAPAGFRPAPAPLPRLLASGARPYLTLRRAVGLRLADHAHARRALLAGTVADGARLDAESTRRLLRASARATSLRPALAVGAAADLRPQLRRVQAPLGLIWGGLDRVVPAHTAERILEQLPDTPIELIGDAGHVPQLEAPQRFVEALERLFSRLP